MKGKKNIRFLSILSLVTSPFLPDLYPLALGLAQTMAQHWPTTGKLWKLLFQHNSCEGKTSAWCSRASIRVRRRPGRHVVPAPPLRKTGQEGNRPHMHYEEFLSSKQAFDKPSELGKGSWWRVCHLPSVSAAAEESA
ncbi:hypothetical protein DFJ73DRAFT_809925 [Zopfochytrium polystomum]|nr:hypothetical protein DFJ73DRAFT_809925 [Zopfochytrium polystomum]